jgi:hypothetical protein
MESCNKWSLGHLNVSIVKSSSARLGGRVVVSRGSITESMVQLGKIRTPKNEKNSQSAEEETAGRESSDMRPGGDEMRNVFTKQTNRVCLGWKSDVSTKQTNTLCLCRGYYNLLSTG